MANLEKFTVGDYYYTAKDPDADNEMNQDTSLAWLGYLRLALLIEQIKQLIMGIRY